MNGYTKIKYDCRNTTYRIEKKQYGHLGAWEITKMYIHLLRFPFCRLYKKQSIVITRAIGEIFNKREASALDTPFKEALQRIIEERVNKK